MHSFLVLWSKALGSLACACAAIALCSVSLGGFSQAFAQPSTLIDVPDPPPLASPSLLDRAVFEQPLPLAAGCIIASLLAGAIARSRTSSQQRKALGVASIALFVLGVGAYVAGRVVHTPRERMLVATRALVDAVATANVDAVRAGLTNDCTLTYFEAPLGLPAKGILDRVATQFAGGGIYSLEDYTIRAIQAAPSRPGFGQVQVKVWAKAKAGFPINSWWRLDYVEQEGTWRANAIMAVSISGLSNASGR
jgi:hypothetical protein